MEQIRNYEWAQDKLNKVFESDSEDRHLAQMAPQEPGNRAQRRERERQERRLKKTPVKQ